jgi:rubrerythrin
LNFFQDLKEKLEKSVETAGQKSQKMLEMSRLTLRIKGKKEDIEHEVSKLGWQVYRHWEEHGNLELTDSIVLSLESIRDQQKRLEALTKELEELKKKEIVSRKEAERVPLDLASDEAEGGKPEALVSSVIYICPFCARQIAPDDQSCPHCQKRFY